MEVVSALPLKLSHLGEEWVLDFRQIGRKMGSLVFGFFLLFFLVSGQFPSSWPAELTATTGEKFFMVEVRPVEFGSG